MPHTEMEQMIDAKIQKAIRKHEMIVSCISSIMVISHLFPQQNSSQ